MELLTIQCWVHDADSDAGRIFPVEISAGKTVGDLKDVIKNKKSVDFRDIDAEALDLYHITLPDDDQRLEVELDQIKTSSHNLKSRLNPRARLSNLFKPDLVGDEMHLIIIKAPTSPTKPPVTVPDMVLNCWVRGQQIDRIFRVETSTTKTVGDLREVIKNKTPVDFRDVDAHHLTLYKFIRPCDDSLENTLRDLTISQLEKPLLAVHTLSTVFELPPVEGCLHLIVGMWHL
ncbi:hypothetical protein PAXRUDRAFT_835007 [Paxillus rubicundulus Ve08.2h10]|uniref:Crinkler effector protein N-terminal domain-containing protein n=1 Tax=Paxillus rubicundulus Ve08.2h10 TaxID=930991 RepID=A0A0D0DH80_9AGAM|nr:hypothetical protein PAXRUDRAFT_835007 [Paxillus rubicundulus Ve08.2h10]